MVQKKKKKRKKRDRPRAKADTRIWVSPYTERFWGTSTDGDPVVVERLRTELRNDEGAEVRFGVMGALRAYLHHPQIMPITGVMYEGQPAIVSAPGKGVYLSHVEQPVSALVLARAGEDISRALAHLAKIAMCTGVEEFGVHGHVGPDNLFLCDGGWTFLDGIGSFLFHEWGAEGVKRIGNVCEVLVKEYPAEPTSNTKH